MHHPIRSKHLRAEGVWCLSSLENVTYTNLYNIDTLLVLANRPTDDAPVVLDLTNGCPAAGLGAQYLLWLVYKVAVLEFCPVTVMCRDSILFCVSTFTVLTVLTSALVQMKELFCHL